MSERDDDIALLKEAIDKTDDSEVPTVAAANESFCQMLERLEKNSTWTLTDKQREWAAAYVDKPLYKNLYSSGRVPPGRDVPTPEVLKHRPLKPPGRK